MDELLLLIQAQLDGTLSEEEARKLEARLLNDPQAMQLFVDTYRIDQQLRSVLPSEQTSVRVEQIMAAPGEELPRANSVRKSADQVVRFFSRPTPLSMTVAALVICVIVTAMAFMAPPFYRALTQSDRDELEQERVLVAHFTNSRRAVWPAGEEQSRGDKLLTGDRLNLLEGVAEFTYTNGTRVLLEGPTIFHVRSLEAGELESGKLTAYVPEAAVGYTVQTEVVDVQDLGTQFGVQYTPEGVLDVHVVAGSVALEPGKKLRTRQFVSAGEAWRFDAADASLAKLPYDAEQFVLQLPPADHSRSFDQWQEFYDIVRQDKHLLAYYAFQRDDASPGTLPNCAAHGAADDGAIAGPQWTTGRWPEKDALRFGKEEQYVHINFPGEYEQLTLAAWVKLDSGDISNGAVLMSKGQGQKGVAHWLTNHDASQMQFTVIEIGGHNAPLENLRAGGWNFLAVTCDGATGEVRHYINGREISRGKLAGSSPLKLGEATIGNWLPSQQRPLAGAIDEMYVFDRVLTAGELKGIYLLDSRPFD